MAASANSTTSSRRTVLRGLATLPLVTATALLVPDPVFDVIDRHKKALAYRDSIHEGDPRQTPSENAELELWWEMVGTKPTTVAGLAAMATHIDAYPDLRWMVGEDGLIQAVSTMAEACRELAKA